MQKATATEKIQQVITGNRVSLGIASAKAAIASRLASSAITQQIVDDLNKTLDMQLDEYVKFQELKSLSSINGKLTLEEANLIYDYLGNTPAHFNKQDVAVKSVLTKIFGELLAMSSKKKSRVA
jgi:pantothenate kinase